MNTYDDIEISEAKRGLKVLVIFLVITVLMIGIGGFGFLGWGSKIWSLFGIHKEEAALDKEDGMPPLLHDTDNNIEHVMPKDTDINNQEIAKKLEPVVPQFDVGPLPQWDLGKIYPKATAYSSVEAEISRLDADVSKFASDYKGRIAKLSAEALLTAVQRYEGIHHIIGRIHTYSGLNMALDPTDNTHKLLHGRVSVGTAGAIAKIAFFDLELMEIPASKFATLCKKSPALATYKPYFADILRFKIHMLGEPVERYAIQKKVTGVDAWVQFFDETWSRMSFSLDDQLLSPAGIYNVLQEQDAGRRQRAAASINKVLVENGSLFTFVMNTIVRDKLIDNKLRNFSKPMSARNLENNVTDGIVDTMINSVKARYKSTAHRYYALKAKMMLTDKVKYYDRFAPLPFASDRHYTWQQARDIVLSSYRAFSPKMADIGAKFFDNSWIDAAMTSNKDAGAFAHPSVPSLHPFILLNYSGKPADVSTLAHELGHGIHQFLANKQGVLMSGTPLILAETASIFGEELVFRNMLKQVTDKKEKIDLLVRYIESRLGAIVSQTAYTDFELQLHRRVDGGYVPESDINAMWISAQSAALGNAVDLVGYEYSWMRIPHFIHSPFYVYSYVFGNLLATSLYSAYSQGHVGDFEKKYITFLESAGSKPCEQLVKLFGFSIDKPEFWHMGLDMLASTINELEEALRDSGILTASPASSSNLAADFSSPSGVSGVAGDRGNEISAADLSGSPVTVTGVASSGEDVLISQQDPRVVTSSAAGSRNYAGSSSSPDRFTTQSGVGGNPGSVPMNGNNSTNPNAPGESAQSNPKSASILSPPAFIRNAENKKHAIEGEE